MCANDGRPKKQTEEHDKVEILTSDAARALAWAGVTVPLGCAAWRLSGRFAPNEALSARVLHTTIISWAVIVGAATLLGSAGVLLPSALLACVAVAAALLWFLGRPLAPAEPADRSGLILWAALIAFWSGHIVLQGILRFPTNWDTLMYHLPLVDQWLQAKNLYAPRDAIWYNPGNNELLGLWLVAPFTGDFLIGLNNIPAVTVLVCGGMELAKQLGLRRPFVLLGGVALAANHIVFRQITAAENDVAVAGLFLAALFYGARYRSTARGGDLVLAAVSIGLLAGTKYYALGYGAVAGGFLVISAYLAHGSRAAARAVAVGIAGALLLGGYWYLRNMWLTGTPIYPKGFTPQTDVLSQSSDWRGGIWTTTLLGSGRSEVLPLTVLAVQGMAGPCHVVALLGLPIFATWLLVSSRLFGRTGTCSDPFLRATMVVPLLGSALIWVITPWAIEIEPGTLNMLRAQYSPIRFGLSFLSLNLIVLLVMGQDLGDGLRACCARLLGRHAGGKCLALVGLAPFALLGIGTAFTFFRAMTAVMARGGLVDALLISGLVVLVGANLVLMLSCWPGLRPWLFAGSITGLLVAGAWTAESLSRRWHAGYTQFYDQMFKVNTFSSLARRDVATTRLCALTYRYYPFLGSRRQFHVARSHRQASYDMFRAYLLTHRINVIVCERDPNPNRDDWYRDPIAWIQDPTIFRRFEDKSSFHVYEVDVEKLENSVKPARPVASAQ